MRFVQPLGRRLPLLIILLLSLVGAGMSWSAYDQIRHATLDASEAHLEASGQQIAALLDSSLRQARRGLAPLGSDPRIISALRASPLPRSGGALSMLDSVRKQTPHCVAVSVLTRSGARVAVAGSARLAQATERDVAAIGRSRVSVSGFIALADTLAYGITFPVTTSATDTTGYVVATMLIKAGNGGAVSRMIGPGAHLLVGSAHGGVWTNLDSVVPGPAAALIKARRGTFTASDGGQRVGLAFSVPGTPWLIWLEESLALPLATARRYLTELIVVGFLFVLAGALGAWLIIRRVTNRLEEVRRAAETVASGATGETSVHIRDRRDDEIGDLVRSFNTMAERVRATNQELTDRAKTLEQRNQDLRDSEARYRQLVEQSPDGVIVHRAGNIIFANPVAVRMLGASGEEDLIGRSVFDFVDDSQREVARERVAEILSSQRASKLIELLWRRLDGSTFTVEVSGVPVVLDGLPSVQTLVRDVSERKSLETQLRQSQKMEAVGRLAGGIAHDFNNLLTIINSGAELALAHMTASEPARQDIDAIRQAGVSAARLTRQMLAFSRKQVLAPRRLDVNEAITGLTAMLQRVLGEEIEVVTTLRSGLGAVWADAGQLEQVVMNLAVNARDAMPTGGTLRIETDEVSLSEACQGHRCDVPPGRYTTLAVSDTGVGMNAHVKERLFEPFFTTKQPGHGTGLGLATVYGIVKQSGGYISVQSEPRRGTTFRIYLPRHAETDAEQRLHADELVIPPVHTAAILLVEDDASVRHAVRRMLEKTSHEVHEAGSGSEAMDLFGARQGRIDLVITDMILPKMTGAELVHQLRRSKPALRAVIMSGYSKEAVTLEWRLPTNSIFIEKPLSPVPLLRAVSQALGEQ
jgi:PAS domain S-box-containing protein